MNRPQSANLLHDVVASGAIRVVVALVVALAPAALLASEVSFMRDVAPILLTRCVGCHGPNKAEGAYRLHTFEFLTQAGDSEATPVEAGDPDASELIARITETDESMRMPQEDDPLSAEEVDILRRWIDQGAKFDGRDPRVTIKSQLPPREHPDPPAKYPAPTPVHALAFSPAGDALAVGGHHEVTIWNPQTGELVQRIKKLPQTIQSIQFTRAGDQLIIGGGSPGDYGEASIVDLADSSRKVLGVFEDVVLATALSHDETLVVATSADRSVRAYSLPDGAEAWTSSLHSDWVTCAAFSADDRFVATGSKDFTIKILEAKTGALYTTYNGHKRYLGAESGRFEIYSLTFADSGPLAFSGGEGRSIRVWEPEKAKEESGSAAEMEIRFFKPGHTKFIQHNAKHSVFDLVARGGQLFAATGDGPIKQYDAATLEPVREYSGHTDWVFAADYHPGANLLASGAFNGEVRVWNTQTGELIATFLAAPGLEPVSD